MRAGFLHVREFIVLARRARGVASNPICFTEQLMLLVLSTPKAPSRTLLVFDATRGKLMNIKANSAAHPSTRSFDGNRKKKIEINAQSSE
jgi:hypothetical protein